MTYFIKKDLKISTLLKIIWLEELTTLGVVLAALTILDILLLQQVSPRQKEN
jgi:hypothetical protein